MYKEVWDKPKGTKYNYKSADYSIYEDSDNECTIWLDPSSDPRVDLTDWYRNFTAIPIPIQFGDIKVLVHKGFWEAFEELVEDLLPRIKDYQYVNVNGYSHGGATGQLLVLSLKLLTGKVVKSAVFFGCPKVFFFNHNYFNIKKIIKDIQIIKLGSDIVHEVPFFPYYHVGNINKIKYDKNKFPKSLIEDHGDYWRYYSEKK